MVMRRTINSGSVGSTDDEDDMSMMVNSDKSIKSEEENSQETDNYLQIEPKIVSPSDADPEVVYLTVEALTSTNSFVCDVCHKGFVREQNLQLHRRGHNIPWSLKQKEEEGKIVSLRRKVYVCPEPTCQHHDPSRALGDLTGIKKHFGRKHGDKKHECSRCGKMYAVKSDLNAHVKHCGTKEYPCHCGLMFSRKDAFSVHQLTCQQPMATLSSYNKTVMDTILTKGPSSSLGLDPVFDFAARRSRTFSERLEPKSYIDSLLDPAVSLEKFQKQLSQHQQNMRLQAGSQEVASFYRNGSGTTLPDVRSLDSELRRRLLDSLKPELDRYQSPQQTIKIEPSYRSSVTPNSDSSSSHLPLDLFPNWIGSWSRSQSLPNPRSWLDERGAPGNTTSSSWLHGLTSNAQGVSTDATILNALKTLNEQQLQDLVQVYSLLRTSHQSEGTSQLQAALRAKEGGIEKNDERNLMALLARGQESNYSGGNVSPLSVGGRSLLDVLPLSVASDNAQVQQRFESQNELKRMRLSSPSSSGVRDVSWAREEGHDIMRDFLSQSFGQSPRHGSSVNPNGEWKEKRTL